MSSPSLKRKFWMLKVFIFYVFQIWKDEIFLPIIYSPSMAIQIELWLKLLLRIILSPLVRTTDFHSCFVQTAPFLRYLKTLLKQERMNLLSIFESFYILNMKRRISNDMLKDWFDVYTDVSDILWSVFLSAYLAFSSVLCLD